MKRRGRGTWDVDKPPIITIVERKTKYTIFFVAKNLSKKLIWNLINKLCNNPITVYTDDFTIYSYLESHQLVKNHFSINHSIKEYANGNNHVNNAENRHSIIRPYLNIFRGISKKYLEKYLIIIQYKINYKKEWKEKILRKIIN